MITIAAAADLHLGLDSAGSFKALIEGLDSSADLLLLAGDLTNYGDPAEARVFTSEIAGLNLPVVTVLGNHDYHAGAEREIRSILEDAGVTVLEGESVSVSCDGGTVGVAGIKGFGGGFAGACAADFGEPEMKQFVAHTRAAAQNIENSLSSLEGDVKIALLHYSPIEATLKGERLEIYPFLGSYLLAEAVDRAGADIVLHGHAHTGAERGTTPGGIPVRNVAQPVIGHPYALYRFHRGQLSSDSDPNRAAVS